jgi:quinol monooxygenase YgiN
VIVVMQFAPDEEAGFVPALEVALATLAARPGYLGGRAGRSLDDPHAWILVTEWASVGDYRRALGNYEVKLHATPLLAQALDRPSAFEELLALDPAGTLVRHASDRAEDRTTG